MIYICGHLPSVLTFEQKFKIIFRLKTKYNNNEHCVAIMNTLEIRGKCFCNMRIAGLLLA